MSKEKYGLEYQKILQFFSEERGSQGYEEVQGDRFL